MEIRIRSTGQVMDEDVFRTYLLENDGPAYRDFTDEVADALGADAVREGARPHPQSIYETVVRDGVEQIDGVWYSRYVIGPIFTDTDSETAAQQEAAHRAQVDDAHRAANKQKASQLLIETDYLTTPDASAHVENLSAILAYRAALRVIAVAPPVVITEWPIRPQTVWKL